MAQQDPGIFTGGQMTDLPPYPGTRFDGTELIELVAPGNVALGINYSITTRQMTELLNPYLNTIIVAGATLAVPYTVLTTDTRVLLNKTIGSASYIQFGNSFLQPSPVLIKDIKGDADVNPITITFFGGQLVDGLGTVTIATSYGSYWFNPLQSGWYL